MLTYHKLLSYDGQAIAYDTIGNPTSYMGVAMTWSNGRELSSIIDGNKTISYTYTTDGIRLSKTVNNIKTSYILDSSTILSETTGNETLNYYCDSISDLQQIGYKKGTAAEVYYLAAHNGQGDVIAIYNASDSTLVGTYTYDAWGKILSANTASSTSDPNGILTKNPFRYKGYYYDRETGYYYLQSRYYNPGLGRFLNADAILGEMGDLLGNNLFIYCQGNPIMYIDTTGYQPKPEKIEDMSIGGADPFILIDGTVRTIRNAIRAYRISKAVDRVIYKIVNKGGSEVVAKPNQLHHFATNKSIKYTSQFEEITKKYGLDLDDAWNKEFMPHQGRHPNAYHDWMLEELQSLDSIAKGNKDVFLKMFEDVKKTVIDNPDMLRKAFWE
ncbi:MAG: RHS repeat-associated core domain-containing protein [Ignavibacteriales bacterium]